MPEIINNSQIKVIQEIYKNPGVNLRELIQKTRLSPNYVSKYVNLLANKGIIKEEKLKKKRVYLRRFFLNLKSRLAKNLFSLVKEEEKELFFQKYPKLKPIFEQIISISGIDIILIYGSYARFAAEKESDIDILIVGKIKNKDRIREVLVSLDKEVSIKIETQSIFKKRIHDDLHKQILKENILIYDSGKFIELLAN